MIVPALVFLAGAAGFATAMLAGAALILALMLPLAFAILGAHVPRPPAADRRGCSRRTAPAERQRRGRARPRCAASPSGACRRPSRSPSRRKPASSCTRSPSWSRPSGATRPASPSPSPQHGHRRAPDARRALGADQPAHGQRPVARSQAAALAVMTQTRTPRRCLPPAPSTASRWATSSRSPR